MTLKESEDILRWLLRPEADLFMDLLKENMRDSLWKSAESRFDKMSLWDSDPAKCETGESLKYVREAMAFRVTMETIKKVAKAIETTHTDDEREEQRG